MTRYVDRYLVNKKEGLAVLENWTEDIFINLNIKKINYGELNFVIAGNLGEAQGIPELINTMPKLKNLFENSKRKS